MVPRLFHEEDRSLVARVVAGDAEAFQAFEAKTRAIVGSCLSRACATRRMSSAETHDLKQAFYLLLIDRDFRVLRTYRGESALTTWIHTVATRHFRRALARLAARREDFGDRSANEELVATADGPEQERLRHEQIRRVREVIAGLKPDEQALIKLLVEQEAPARVAATTLGITADGVRMRKMRILRKLAEHLGDVWP